MADNITRALSDAKVRNAKTDDKEVKLTDGGGLFLLVKPNGAKLWRYKFRINGREGLLSIGAYPDVSLAAARGAHQEARAKVAAGENPVHSRQLARRGAEQITLRAERGTFALALKSWQDATEPTLSERTVEWRRWECERHLIPAFGRRPIWTITRPEVATFLRDIEKTAPTVAKIVRTYLVHIFERAIDEGLLETSPVPSVHLLKSRRWVSHQAMAMDRYPAFLANLLAADGSAYTKGALLLVILTACRKTEAIGARWDEFDFKNNTWTIPAERMKMRKEHWVPLSKQAVKLLQGLRGLSGNHEHVFPHYYTPNAPMHATTLGLMMRKVRDQADTVHGFRSMFSTHMNAQRKEDGDVIELCLAHAPKDVVRAIYNRHQYQDERRDVMQRWADALDAQVAKMIGQSKKIGAAKKHQQSIAA